MNSAAGKPDAGNTTPVMRDVDVEAFERYRSLVDDWPAFVAALKRPLPGCIWTHTLRGDSESLRSKLNDIGIQVEPLSWNAQAFRLPANAKPGKIWPVIGGLFHIQEEVSMIPAVLLDPRPGERVLDLCAAPGNKTAQMAVAMRNRGTLIANDISYHRIKALRNGIERLGLFNITTTNFDGSRYPRQAGNFDRVLVDAPCSCEGTVRKSSIVAKELRSGGFRYNVKKQMGILRTALRLCRVGGRVVYSTCTFAPEENEEVLDTVLRELPPGSIEVIPTKLPGFVSSPGIIEWQDRSYLPEIARTMRVWPHQNDSGGFFVAVLEKRAEIQNNPVRDEAPPLDGTEMSPLLRERIFDDSKSQLQSGLEYIETHFGIEASAFDDYRIYRGKKSGFCIVAKDHQPPPELEPDATGVFFLKTEPRYPKLSTSAVMAFGHLATKNIIDLDLDQLMEYILRRDIDIRPAQLRNVAGQGYVIIRHRDMLCGMGLYRPGASSPGGKLESYFPKGWAWGFREQEYRQGPRRSR